MVSSKPSSEPQPGKRPFPDIHSITFQLNDPNNPPESLDIDQNFVFLKDMPAFNIKAGDRIFGFEKEETYNKSRKDLMSLIARKQNSDASSLITLVYVKSEDLNHPDIRLSTKKFKATKSVGYCHACYNVGQDPRHHITTTQQMRNFKRHTTSKHEIVIKECQECHKSFDRSDRYRHHICTMSRRSERTYTKYTTRPVNSVLEVLSRQNGTVPNPLGAIDNNEADSTFAPPLTNLQMHTICHSGKDLAMLISFDALHPFMEGQGF